jgi:hypothetical protein
VTLSGDAGAPANTGVPRRQYATVAAFETALKSKLAARVTDRSSCGTPQCRERTPSRSVGGARRAAR